MTLSELKTIINYVLSKNFGFRITSYHAGFAAKKFNKQYPILKTNIDISLTEFAARMEPQIIEILYQTVPNLRSDLN